jgi:glycosyltransferase involved in cell wall biosynthesis
VIYACNAAGVPVVQTLHNYRLLCPNGFLFRSGKVCEACVKTILPWPGVVHRCYRGSALGTAVVGTGLAIHRFLGTYARRVDCFIAITEFAKNKFVSTKLPGHKFAVVPNWVANDPGPGEGHGGFFLFVGRLSPEKGLATLLESWPKMKLPARLKIVGTGPLEADVAAAARCGVGVEHVGYQPPSEVLKLMQQAIALIIPSEWYEAGLPQTLAEAYATGTPVIASRLGSLQELVVDRRTGLLFPPGDADALAQKIEWIITNPQQLTSMRAAARAEYEARYTAESSYRLLMGIYHRVVGTAAVNV